MSPSTLGRRAATKAVVATGAVVALISGGFAMAATGNLPSLTDQASDRATEAVAATHAPSKTPTTSPATESDVEEDVDEDVEETEASSVAPTPSFKGLCKAFLANDKSAHGKALESAAFTALTTEADGADLATYCVALVGEPKETGRPTDKPAPGKPTDKPAPTTARPTDKPAPGKPTDKPAPPAGQSSGSKPQR